MNSSLCKKDAKKGKKKPAFQVRDMKHTFISLDKAFEYIGDNSKYQKKIIYILAFQWVFYSFYAMGMTLMFQVPDFQCYNERYDTYYSCLQSEVCDLLENNQDDYFKVKQNSMFAVYFKLVCEDSWYLDICPSVFFIGTGLSSLIMSYFADKYGRRKIIVSCQLIGAVSLASIAFSPSVQIFLAINFLAGFGLGGFETTIQAYCSEISGSRFRNFSSTILFITWGSAQLLYTVLYSFTKDWRYLCLISGIPLLLSHYFVRKYFVESPRFLVGKGRYKEARQVFKYISEFNLRPAFEFHLYDEMESYNNKVSVIINTKKISKDDFEKKQVEDIVEQELQNKLKQKASYFIFCSNKEIFINTINTAYCWFTRYFIYYSISFNINSMGHQALSFFLLGTSEVLAALISIPLKLSMKRVKAFKLSMIIILIMAILLAFVGKMPLECYMDSILCWQEVCTLLCAIGLKFAITLFGVILMTYTSEIYPTVFRSQGMGICMLVGQLGSTYSPIFTSQIEHTFKFSPLSSLGFLACIGYIFTYFLKETYQLDMKDYLIENNKMDQFKRRFSKNLKQLISFEPNPNMTLINETTQYKDVELQPMSQPLLEQKV